MNTANSTRTRTTHGKCPRGQQPKKYTAWRNVKARIGNPLNPAYKDYGGRGITMHAAWFADFATFDREVPDPPARAATLDRIDNERGYEPGNVRWTDRTTQANNRRNNISLTFRGRTQTLAQWCTELSLKRVTIHHRLKMYGWTVDEALTGQRDAVDSH